MDGHISDCRRVLNGNISNSDTSAPSSHIQSHDVEFVKFKILEILENDGFIYANDGYQLKTSLYAEERLWIWKL